MRAPGAVASVRACVLASICANANAQPDSRVCAHTAPAVWTCTGRSARAYTRAHTRGRSFLDVDGKQLVNNEGLHGMVERCGTLSLTAGSHNVYIRGFQVTPHPSIPARAHSRPAVAGPLFDRPGWLPTRRCRAGERRHGMVPALRLSGPARLRRLCAPALPRFPRAAHCVPPPSPPPPLVSRRRLAPLASAAAVSSPPPPP